MDTAKEALKKYARYFDEILDVIDVGIYITDKNGLSLKVNKTYEELTGITQAEIENRLVTDLQKEGKFDVVLNPEIVESGQKQIQVQTTGVGRKVVLDGYPVKDGNGRVVLVVTFVRDITKLSQMQEELSHQQELINHYQKQAEYSGEQAAKEGFQFVSKEMRELLHSLKIIAHTDATVLLLGETGVGKSMVAHRIHEYSGRKNQPFFVIDCSTLPPNLIESELFGFEPGAFSGAHSKGKAGLVEMAHGGTLFLDEIGELPLPMQSKLLRVLQEKEVLRVGSTRVRKVDVRFIAATNRNLEREVAEGTFRSDLYYRLLVAVLKIPALRERKEDILLLGDFFLERYTTKYKRKVSLSPEVRNLLQQYNWPGNIRELDNFIQGLVITRDKSVIQPEDLPKSMSGKQQSGEQKNWEGQSLNEIMDEFEKNILQKTLATQGSIAEVAKYFKVDRVTIYRKLKKHNLSPADLTK